MEVLVSILSKEDRSSREVRCPLDDRIVVGRGDECAVPLEGSAISREHLVVELGEGNTILLTDVSANGCWVNGNRIPKSRRRPVVDSDVIELPGFELRIQRVLPAPAPVQAPQTVDAVQFTAPAPAAHVPSRGAAATFLHAFTRDEKFAAALAFLSLGFVVFYALG